MRTIVFSLLFFYVACNNNKDAGEKGGKDSSVTVTPDDNTDAPAKGSCGDLVLFKQGAVIEAASYDPSGKETSRQVSKVISVTPGGGMTTAEVEMKSTGTGDPGAVLKGVYKCDGKTLYMDLTSLFAGMKMNGATVEGSPVEFPIMVSVGQSLPDASYSFTMKNAGKEMKITSFIRNRKVEGKEQVTTGAGTFESYIITSEIDAETSMPGMDEKTKQMMEGMKKSMPKQRFKMWYAPGVSIVKMELYMGGRLQSRNEVTNIKN